MRLSYTFMRWVLFLAMAFTVPTFYFLFVVGGWISYVGLVLIALQDILFPFSFIFLVGIVHLAVYGSVLFGVSTLAAKLLCRCAWQVRVAVLGAILAALMYVSLKPVYGISHGSRELHNAYRSLLELQYLSL